MSGDQLKWWKRMYIDESDEIASKKISWGVVDVEYKYNLIICFRGFIVTKYIQQLLAINDSNPVHSPPHSPPMDASIAHDMLGDLCL